MAQRLITFILRFCGLIPEEPSTDYIRHVTLAPIWETVLFITLPVVGVTWLVWWNWNIAWVSNYAIDRSLKMGLIVLVIRVSPFAFVTFHRPRHFLTWWKQKKANRVYKAMEGAWMWNNFERARLLAIKLIDVTSELWILEGGHDYVRQKGLALYIICKTGTGFESVEGRRMGAIFIRYGILKSHIMTEEDVKQMFAKLSNIPDIDFEH